MAVWNSGFVSPGVCNNKASDIKLVYLYSTDKFYIYFITICFHQHN